MLLVRRFVPDWRPPGGQRFDAWGAVILLVTLVMLALGLTFGPDTGWGTPAILALLVGAVIGFVIFVIVEARIDQPMIDLRLFRDSLFSVSLLTGFMVFVVIAGMFVLPFYLERVKGFDTAADRPAADRFPGGAGPARAGRRARSRIATDRAGISLIGLVIFGGACLSIGVAQRRYLHPGLYLHLLPVGLGAGMFQSPNNSAIMGSAPRERLGVVSGLLSLSRTFGQVTGLPLMGAIYASRVYVGRRPEPGTDASDAPPWAIVEGLHTAFIAAAVLIGVAILLAGYAVVIDWRRRARAAEAAQSAR